MSPRIQTRRHKYGAQRTEVDGIVFHSKREAARYQELKLLERAKKVWGLELQPRYRLTLNGFTLGHYVGDFRYYEADERGTGRLVVEDVKGVKTPLYRWKRKHMDAQYGIHIREV